MDAKVLTLSDAKSGSSVKIATGLGFNCFSWTLGDGREMLWHDPAFLTGGAKPTRSGIPLLFPFAGRIKGQQITFGGVTYTLAGIHDDLGNPIHGYVLKAPWRVVENTGNRVTGEFQASVDDAEHVGNWPADYRIRLTYVLSANKLRMEVEVHNPDDKLLPFGFGAHPYFKTPKLEPGVDATMTVPTRHEWMLDELLLPKAEHVKTKLGEQLQEGLPLGEAKLDTLLTGLIYDGEQFTSKLVTGKNTLTVAFGKEFAECVVFIPPHREAVCIEPYSTAPDAFRLQTMGMDASLKLLAPGKNWSSWMDMIVS